ncbi:hypothetical protein LJR015_001283 [Peribacillus frigoritolerans]|uniref:hypothetical protein n=1 Tax=Peribacillus frigoritolerans TaxID=450367 RepID=UPI003ECDA044
MKKKKVLLSTLLSTGLLLSLGVSNGFAATDDLEQDLNVVTTETQTYFDEDSKLVTETKGLNKNGEVIEVSISKDQTNLTNASGEIVPTGAGVYHASSRSTLTKRAEAGWAQLRVYGNGFSDSYTNSKKTTRKSISKIGVSTTLFMNGSVEHSSSNTKLNASTASASAKQQAWQVPVKAHEVKYLSKYRRIKSLSNYFFKNMVVN